MIRALNPRTVAHVAGAAALLGMMAIPGSASAAPAQPPAICAPITGLIEYWLPITDHAVSLAPPVGHAETPGYPWKPAATEIFAIGQYAGSLSFNAEAVGTIIGALGGGADPSLWWPHLRADLAAVRAVCPSLPAAVVNGPLPR